MVQEDHVCHVLLKFPTCLQVEEMIYMLANMFNLLYFKGFGAYERKKAFVGCKDGQIVNSNIWAPWKMAQWVHLPEGSNSHLDSSNLWAPWKAARLFL